MGTDNLGRDIWSRMVWGAQTILGVAFAAALIVFAIPSGLIATRIGRKPTILIGLGGMAAGLIIGFFLRQPTALLILLAIMGAFWALVNINSLPMVYDLGGEERIGAFTGLYYFASSAAAITGPILVGGLIDLAGVDYLDSSALGMLLLLRDRAAAASKAVSLENCRGNVRQVLDIANFGKLFKIS